jgi:phosphatidylglycerophosphate synthase
LLRRVAVTGLPPTVWARVDAAEVPPEIGPATRVGGLSLVARHVRTGVRLGWVGTQVVVDGDDRRVQVQAALERDRTPGHHTIQVVSRADTAPAGARVVPLKLPAIYDRDVLARAAASGDAPEALATVGHPADIADVERLLVSRLRKSVAHDGVVAYYVMRPLSRLIVRGLVNTRVTPNQVTVVALVCGVLGGLLTGFGGHAFTAVGALLAWAGAVIDCVDGEIARLRLEGSRLGQWLDTLADDLTTLALVGGLGVGLYRDGAGPLWLQIGLGAGLMWAITEAVVYVDMVRAGLPIDTAQYPWFFGVPSQGPAQGASLLSRLVYGIGFLFKRDAFLTLITIALLLDYRRLATAGLAAGCAFTFGLLLVHKTVGALRARR